MTRPKRRERPARCPALVAIFTQPKQSLEIQLALQGFRLGWADRRQFNAMLDCADMLLMAAHHKNAKGETEVAHAARETLHLVRHRFVTGEQAKVDPEDLETPEALVIVSEDFWKRQSGALYEQAKMSLEVARARQKANPDKQPEQP